MQKSAFETKKKTKRQKPVLTSEPRYTSAPGNRSACRQTEREENKWTEAIKNVWHTIQFMQNTEKPELNCLQLHANQMLLPHLSHSQVNFWRWFIAWGSESVTVVLWRDHKMSSNQMVSENTFTPEAQPSSPVNILIVIMDRWQADSINRTIMR